MSRENRDRAEKTPAAAPPTPGPRQQTAGRGRTGGLLPLLAAALLGAAAGAAATWCAARQAQFSQLARLAYGTARAGAEARQAVLAALRPLFGAAEAGAGLPPIPPAEAEAFLRGYGYRPAELPLAAFALWAAAAAALLAGLLVWAVLAFARRRRRQSAAALADDLDRLNQGRAGAGTGLLPAPVGDEFGRLRDELYKTVTALQTTRQKAEAARARYAQNLADIAHQMKTPIAAASANLQLLEQAAPPQSRPDGGAAALPAVPLARAQSQLQRLDALGQALLTLSRIDAGVLPLARAPVDAYTALSLAAETLLSLPQAAGLRVELPEQGPAGFTGDLDWTVEALLNLMKNCAEHSPPGGCIRCGYAQNPLYLELTIEDEGPGFAQKELPHLFERFYRGSRAAGQGAGIGLALARQLIEAQNGVLTAENRPTGGARFSVRLYPR